MVDSFIPSNFGLCYDIYQQRFLQLPESPDAFTIILKAFFLASFNRRTIDIRQVKWSLLNTVKNNNDIKKFIEHMKEVELTSRSEFALTDMCRLERDAIPERFQSFILMHRQDGVRMINNTLNCKENAKFDWYFYFKSMETAIDQDSDKSMAPRPTNMGPYGQFQRFRATLWALHTNDKLPSFPSDLFHELGKLQPTTNREKGISGLFVWSMQYCQNGTKNTPPCTQSQMMQALYGVSARQLRTDDQKRRLHYVGSKWYSRRSEEKKSIVRDYLVAEWPVLMVQKKKNNMTIWWGEQTVVDTTEHSWSEYDSLGLPGGDVKKHIAATKDPYQFTGCKRRGWVDPVNEVESPRSRKTTVRGKPGSPGNIPSSDLTGNTRPAAEFLETGFCVINTIRFVVGSKLTPDVYDFIRGKGGILSVKRALALLTQQSGISLQKVKLPGRNKTDWLDIRENGLYLIRVGTHCYGVDKHRGVYFDPGDGSEKPYAKFPTIDVIYQCHS
jgi:hypothetical protein